MQHILVLHPFGARVIKNMTLLKIAPGNFFEPFLRVKMTRYICVRSTQYF